MRSQSGNNNAYWQDNELAWFDWRLVEANRDMLRFVRELIALRKRHPSLRRSRFLRGRPGPGQSRPDVAWHGRRLDEPPWHDGGARALAFTLAGMVSGEGPLHVVLNMSDAGLEVSLPDLPASRWRRALDTALASPRDIIPPEGQTAVETDRYVAQPRSVVVLEGS